MLVLKLFLQHAFVPLSMSLKGGWPLAHFLAFFARVIQRFLGLTVDHPGTMFCNTVFNIVGFCSGAIVAVFAFVWPFLLMLAFDVFFQRCSGTETLASTWGCHILSGLLACE